MSIVSTDCDIAVISRRNGNCRPGRWKGTRKVEGEAERRLPVGVERVAMAGVAIGELWAVVLAFPLFRETERPAMRYIKFKAKGSFKVVILKVSRRGRGLLVCALAAALAVIPLLLNDVERQSAPNPTTALWHSKMEKNLASKVKPSKEELKKRWIDALPS